MEDYIELLKNKILDLAIKGKLVKQKENAENARILIEEIIEEKRKLIKDKKIKKESVSVIYKSDSDSHYYEKFDDGIVKDITEEIPFDTPKNWCWSRLRNIGNYKKGPFGSALTKAIFVEKSEDTIKVYEQKNAIQKDASLGEYYITKKYFEEKMKGFEVCTGDIIVSCAGTIGETYIMPDNIERGIINQALMRISISSKIYKDFFLIYFDYILKNKSNEKSKGSAMKNIPPFEIFKEFLIPIPSYDEQVSIADNVKRLLDKVDIISKSRIEMLEYKGFLKEKIIDLAIKGKMINQNVNDNSVELFIDRVLEKKRELIESKKIKKEDLSVIYKENNQFYEKFDNGTIKNITDEIPFDIPNNWAYTRLRNISSIISKGTTPKGGKTAYIDDGINFIRAENVQNNQVTLNNIMHIDEQVHNGYLKRSILEEFDILICIAGTLGRSGIITKDKLPANANQAVCFVRLLEKDEYYVSYVQKVISSNIVQSILLGKTKVTAIPNLTLEIIGDCLIPMPPLEEQKRIVEKCNKLLEHIY